MMTDCSILMFLILLYRDNSRILKINITHPHPMPLALALVPIRIINSMKNYLCIKQKTMIHSISQLLINKTK